MSKAPPPPSQPAQPKKPSSKPSLPYKAPPPAASKRSTKKFSLSGGIKNDPEKIIIYGSGGVGKTELASLIKEVNLKAVFIDVEEGSGFIDAVRVDPVPETFEECLDAIDMLINDNSVDVIVIDTLTKIEEIAAEYTIRTIPKQKGKSATSIQDYGWGAGYTHLYDTFMLFLQKLDHAVRSGKHIICICHECTANVPNPFGEDFIRFEPRLQSPKNGKDSIRHRVKEWANHLFFVSIDTIVREGDNKAQGGGTRTIYTCEYPTHWAKSRYLDSNIDYERFNPELWKQLFAKRNQ